MGLKWIYWIYCFVLWTQVPLSSSMHLLIGAIIPPMRPFFLCPIENINTMKYEMVSFLYCMLQYHFQTSKFSLLWDFTQFSWYLCSKIFHRNMVNPLLETQHFSFNILCNRQLLAWCLWGLPETRIFLWK